MDRGEDPTIWCGNLATDVTEELLYELFLQAGPVNRVTIPKDKEGRRRNYGFVTFKHVISIRYALELFSDLSLFNEPLRLKSRVGNAPDSEQSVANYNHLENSSGSFSQLKNGYNARGGLHEQYSNRRQDLLPSYQRNRNYGTPENERYNDRDNRRDGESRDIGRRYSTERDMYSSGRNQRDSYGGERSQRDSYGSERNHREPYSGERSQRDTYSRERAQLDIPSPWMGRSGIGQFPSTPPGSNGSFSLANFEDLARKVPQRTKMVLPKPSQQNFMATAGITQMNAYWPRDK